MATLAGHPQMVLYTVLGMVVMGGYSHSRLREFVFGGVTRALSRSSPATCSSIVDMRTMLRSG